jgi:hypothetical protein
MRAEAPGLRWAFQGFVRLRQAVVLRLSAPADARRADSILKISLRYIGAITLTTFIDLLDCGEQIFGREKILLAVARTDIEIPDYSVLIDNDIRPVWLLGRAGLTHIGHLHMHSLLIGCFVVLRPLSLCQKINEIFPFFR